MHLRHLNSLFGIIEKYLSINWFNPFLTIYFNFRSFPFSQAWRIPVYIYGIPRLLSLKGKMIIIGNINSGMITINRTLCGVPSNTSIKTEIINDGLISFYGKGFIGTGNRIRVYKKAKLKFGNEFKISDMTNIGCYNRIEIGDYTRIAHRCQLFDTNYHYIVNINKRQIPNNIKPIYIGNYCWIGNSTTIMNGSYIPDHTIVASNSLINKDFRSITKYSLIGGIPAKLLCSGLARIENPQIIHNTDLYYENNNEIYNLPKDIKIDTIIYNTQ